jgi:DNA-binding NarL/FixJ family response regulator
VSPEDPEVAFLKTLRLLHVEDDPGAREEIGEFLERRAGAVVTATDGEEGLAAYRAQPAQIIVTDIWMPHMDGLAMAREIRNLDPGVLIIVTTAFEDWDCLSRSIATGIDQYVLKPIQRTRLDFALLTCAHRLRLVASARTSANSLDADERQRLVQLTPREREVLACIGHQPQDGPCPPGQPDDQAGAAQGHRPGGLCSSGRNLLSAVPGLIGKSA